jgi:hypothetical protein
MAKRAEKLRKCPLVLLGFIHERRSGSGRFHAVMLGEMFDERERTFWDDVAKMRR